MKRSLSNPVTALFSKENKSKSFYILALVPTILLSYFYLQTTIGPAIPLYGFIILMLKKHKLFLNTEVRTVQKLFGLIVVFASFFAYFIVSPFFSSAIFYGYANYSLYIIGLFFIFFPIRALKEAFSPLFLVASVFIGTFASKLAESHFTPYIPNFTSFIASLLRIIGMDVAQSSSNQNVITLYSLKGPISFIFLWGCVGFSSVFVFSVILIVIMLEDPSNTKTKAIWSILGVLGIFIVNIIRLVIIFVVSYFSGYEYLTVHLYLGYILFMVWNVIFFYLFSKRNVISQKMTTIQVKISKRHLISVKQI